MESSLASTQSFYPPSTHNGNLNRVWLTEFPYRVPGDNLVYLENKVSASYADIDANWTPQYGLKTIVQHSPERKFKTATHDRNLYNELPWLQLNYGTCTQPLFAYGPIPSYWSSPSLHSVSTLWKLSPKYIAKNQPAENKKNSLEMRIEATTETGQAIIPFPSELDANHMTSFAFNTTSSSDQLLPFELVQKNKKKDSPLAIDASKVAVSLRKKPELLASLEEENNLEPDALPTDVVTDEDSAAAFFTADDSVTNSDLANVRGAYITSNGLQIDFGLINRTVVNGEVANEIRISSTGNTELDNSLQNLIQVGPGGTTVRKLDFDNLPELLTVIQNNVDNTTIQDFNIIDVTVDNVSKFNAQNMVPVYNYHNVMSLK